MHRVPNRDISSSCPSGVTKLLSHMLFAQGPDLFGDLRIGGVQLGSGIDISIGKTLPALVCRLVSLLLALILLFFCLPSIDRSNAPTMYDEAPIPTECHGMVSPREPSAFHHPIVCQICVIHRHEILDSPSSTLFSKGIVLLRLVVPTPAVY
jgi:hypothetical protein